MFHKIIKGLAPVAALAMGTIVAGCDGVNVQIGDSNGVPLAELDQSGPAPEKIILAGPDRVHVATGDALNIAVSGDQAAVDALRFTLEDGALGIMRAKDSGKDIGTATVRVTMPSLTAITMAGSGMLEAGELTGEADVTIAGSGSAKVRNIRATTLDLTIAGSGDFEAAGAVETLDLTVAGSGAGRMAGLKVDKADISIAGSGSTEFASDGTVDASIIGSGSVSVIGSAECTVSAMGSGILKCSNGATMRAKDSEPTDAPIPPSTPGTPPEPENPDS